MKSKHYKETFSKISEEKRKKILETSIIEFANHGFDGANINTIAEKAKVSVGAMYKYFNSKEDLYLSIVDVAIDKLQQVLDEIMASDLDFLDTVEKIIRAIQINSKENIYLTKLYNGMTTDSNPELVWKIAADFEGVTANLYADYIKKFQENGLIRKDIDSKYLAFFLDNLFMMLQFSYACEYYKKRLKMFVSEDALINDELLVAELLKFIKGAFGL